MTDLPDDLRANVRRCCVETGCTCAAARLLVECDRLRAQVASLTAERDSLKPPYESAILAAVRETIWAERGLLAEVRAERDAALARLEKARGLVLEFAANMGPGFFDSYPTLVKLRAALTGTEGPP